MHPAHTVTHDAVPSDAASSAAGQFAYETFYGAAIGGATIALLFLALDSYGGRPLYTPSIIGAALFARADPSAETAVRLDMVALYSAAHLIAFLAFGALASALHARLPRAAARPYVTALLLFLLLTASVVAASTYALSGVAAVIGWHWVLAANVATAAAMAAFLERVSDDATTA